jgi:hypothetical protein
MIGLKLLVHLVAIMARMCVTLPMIDPKAPRVEAEGVDRLQESAIGIAGVNPKFNNHTWL